MKKFIALILCITMLLPLLPVTGLAAKLVESAESKTEMKADKMYYIITPEQFTDIGGWKFAGTDESVLVHYRICDHVSVQSDSGDCGKSHEAETIEIYHYWTFVILFFE